MSGGSAAVLAAGSAAAAAMLLVRPPARRGADLVALLRGGASPSAAGPPPAADESGAPGIRTRRRAVRRRRAVLGLAATTLALTVGPLAGAAIGLVGAVIADRVLDRLEPAAERRRRAVLLEDLPVFADLLAATTRAGIPTARAVAVCARAVGGPLGHSAGRVATALELGAEPARAWQLLAIDEQTAPLATTMIRSETRGLAPGPGLAGCAAQGRRTRAAAAARRAQTVAVSAAAPLGLCFLPAFMLLAVVPTVVSGLAGLLGG